MADNGKCQETKLVTNTAGNSFYVDISDEACGKFGFKHGDRIYDPDQGKEGIIEGVAPSAYSRKSLWHALDGHGGKVRCKVEWREGSLIKVS
jgi:hypothetical protein